MKSNQKQTRTSELEKPKRATKGTKSPNGNQYLQLRGTSCSSTSAEKKIR